jgi:hypothetical protein
MQEYREVLADGLEAPCLHGFGSRPDHDPITFLHGQAQELIAYRTADEIDLHRSTSDRPEHSLYRIDPDLRPVVSP